MILRIDNIEMLIERIDVDCELAWGEETRGAGIIKSVVGELDLSEDGVGDVIAGGGRQCGHDENCGGGRERESGQTEFCFSGRWIMRGGTGFHLVPHD